MAIIIVLLYAISLIFGLVSIEYMVQKDIGCFTAMFVILCPILNTFWMFFRISKWFKTESNFKQDMKKLFDVK